MSCRSNPGNSGMTSLAHARSGLSDAQTLSVFHQALNMGRTNPNPNREQVERFITLQRNQVADHIRAGRLNPEQGERVVARLNRVLEGDLPNGPTFHAWRSIENYSNQANRTAENITTELSRDLGLTPAQAKIRRQELIWEYDRLDPKPRQDFQAIQAKLSEYSRLNTGDSNLVLFPRNAATVYAYSKMIEEAERNLVARPNQRRRVIGSQTIRAAGYHSITRMLELELADGTVHQYSRVPPEVFTRLMSPGRAGQIFSSQVRDRYSERIVPPGQGETAEIEAAQPHRCPICGQFLATDPSSHACVHPDGAERPLPTEYWPAIETAGMAGFGGNAPTSTSNIYVRDGAESAWCYYQNTPPMPSRNALLTYLRQTRQTEGAFPINAVAQVRPAASQRITGSLGVRREGNNLVLNISGLRCGCATYQSSGTCDHLTAMAYHLGLGYTPEAESVVAFRAASAAREQAYQQVRQQASQEQVRVQREAAEARSRQEMEAGRVAMEAATSQAQQNFEAVRRGRNYADDPAAFGEAYTAARQRKERGEPPVPFVTENATGGLGTRGSGRGFGVEIEFDLAGVSDRAAVLRAIGSELHSAGITSRAGQENYHSSTDYTRWRFERDSTVDGEIISPIMYDTPEDWEKLQKVCEIVQRNGGKATTRTGGHVHVACGNFDHTPKNHNNLLGLVKQHEDTLYRLSTNPERGTHRGTQWCRPNNVPANGYGSVNAVRSGNNSHGLGVNFQSVQGSASDHVEFRMYDGSLDPAVIQSQIKLSLGITDAALRHESNAFGTVQEPLGTHKTNNRGAGRLEGAAWENDTQNVRQLLDTIFSREEDKAQAASLFASTKWQN